MRSAIPTCRTVSPLEIANIDPVKNNGLINNYFLGEDLMKNDIDLIVDAAEKYGFNIEFKSKKIFEELRLSPEVNIRINGIEIDLVAPYHKPRFIVECKGVSANSILILIRDSKDKSYLNRRNIIGTNYRIPYYPAGIEVITFTGDFFAKSQKGDELKRTSKHDGQSNFFKAQEQVAMGIAACVKNPLEDIHYLHPIIVTNAKIWVVDYNNSNNTRPQVENYKWVIHKSIQDSQLIDFGPDDESYFYPTIVVNIEYLKELLGQFNQDDRSQVSFSDGKI